MLQNIKKFFHVQFKIEECQDEVYEDSSEEEEDEDEENQENVEKPQFNQTFLFSCIGVGLKNFARKAE